MTKRSDHIGFQKTVDNNKWNKLAYEGKILQKCDPMKNKLTFVATSDKDLSYHLRMLFFISERLKPSKGTFCTKNSKIKR